MIFSVIEIETWKRCRRKWDFQSENRQNLEAIRYAAPLIVGTLVHESIAAKTDAPDTDLPAAFAERATAVVADIESQPDTWPDSPVYEQVALGLQLMKDYQRYYKVPFPEHYKPVRSEQRMIVAIPTSEHWECNNCHRIETEWDAPHTDYFVGPGRCFGCGELGVTWQSHYLRGTMDEMVQDIKTSLLHPVERKTYGQRPKEEKLQNDTQMIAYEWMLQQLFGQQAVGGTLYDGIWKRDSTTKYFKQHYKLSDLFYRHLFIHPQEQIDEYGAFLPAICNEMATVAPSALYYNRRWEGCYDCGMAQLCDATSRGEDVDYIRANYYRQRRAASGQPADPD